MNADKGRGAYIPGPLFMPLCAKCAPSLFDMAYFGLVKLNKSA